jgi:hypothetical protein
MFSLDSCDRCIKLKLEIMLSLVLMFLLLKLEEG